jgi:hypothetical protein
LVGLRVSHQVAGQFEPGEIVLNNRFAGFCGLESK